jgi:speckle-type POZ protein
MRLVRIENAKVSVAPPPLGWKSFHFKVQNFSDLPTTRDHYVETPQFSCNGHMWSLRIYPGGKGDATEGYVSISISHHSEENILFKYVLEIIDKVGRKRNGKNGTHDFEGLGRANCKNFIKRSKLDGSKDILHSDGALIVSFSIQEEPSDLFVPKNPLLNIIQDMFLDEDTADICFEVIGTTEVTGEQKRAKSSELFHAHSQILKKCAPILTDLFDLDGGDGKISTAIISDVKPDIFRHMLYYVYGGSVPDGELKTHAKDIIDAADKYSIVNLKLEAEAAYVKSTGITMDNVMDNLLYADAKNCALLKEAVMNFLAENSVLAAEQISFSDVPGHLMKDLLVAFNRKGSSKKEEDGTTTDELTSLSVSALRRRLEEKGLDIDGSREAMIESIKNNS